MLFASWRRFRGFGRILVFVSCFACFWAVRKQICVDSEKTINCLSWKEAGFCENITYTEYMTAYCNDTCNICGDSKPVCSNTQFKCLEGYPVCVPIMKMCDGNRDCEDGWDEEDCDWEVVESNMTTFKPITDHKILSTPSPTPPPDVNEPRANATIQIFNEQSATQSVTSAMDNGMQCPHGMMGCRKLNKCISTDFWCDGWLDDCGDGEDENPTYCYVKVNKDFLRKEYMSGIAVQDFLHSLLNVKHTHCTLRHYSCKGACTRIPNLETRLCACDPDCFARRDCCPDVVTQCNYENTTEIKERCIPEVFGKRTEITALMIDECPNTATERDSRLCNLTNKDYETAKQAKYLGAPVYAQETGKHYRNFYCAKCNGVKGRLLPWSIWYDCQSTESDYSAEQECSSIVYVPPSSLVKTCKVRQFTDPSFAEAVVTKNQRTAISNCQSVYAPVAYNGTVYRNPYCYFVHRTQVGDKDKKRLFSCDIDNKIQAGCPADYIPCRSSFSCLDKSKRCDGEVDCEDTSDEPVEECRGKKCYGKFQCRVNQHLCLERSVVCDGFTQCPDHSDEENCSRSDSLTINESEHINRGDIYYTLPALANFPTVTNNYEENFHQFNQPQELKRKEPKCIEPLIFDGVICKYNKTLTTDNQDYQKVYMKQDFNVITFNISLTDTGYYRPPALQDNPPDFLTRHSGHYPYQIVDYQIQSVAALNKYTGYLSIRLLTQLEQSENIGNYIQSVRDKETFVQMNSKIYQVDMSGLRHYSDTSQKPSTVIECQHKDGGPRIQVICTGCAYIEYTPNEYTIAKDGKIQLISNGLKLNYEDYELRKNGTIIMCWGTPLRDNDTGDEGASEEINTKWLRIWFGVGYAVCVLINSAAMANNLYYGHKTTLRVFFINYTSLCLIWSFDSLLCACSSVYSKVGSSLHLYGCLGTLAWLIIISFHLLLSVSDANPAVYYSVDNLVYYHISGWLCPFGWVCLFFVLSKCEVIESVESISDPRSTTMSQAGQILHFPVWVLLLVILFLLLTVIAITKKLLTEKKNLRDVEVLTCRLQIKMLILGLFFISAIPWVSVLGLRYWRLTSKYCVIQIIFCLGCLAQALYLIYIIRKLAKGNLEKLALDSPNTVDTETKIPLNTIQPPGPDPAHGAQTDTTYAALPIPLPPKQQRYPRPMTPLYQHPVDKEYTKFPTELQTRSLHNQQQRTYGPHGKEKYKRVVPEPAPTQDQYSHLQGGALGGQAYHAAAMHKARGRKEYYPMTNLGSPVTSPYDYVTPSQSHSQQYDPHATTSSSHDHVQKSSLEMVMEPENCPTYASASPHHKHLQSDQGRLFSSATQLHYPSASEYGTSPVRPRAGSTTLAQVHYHSNNRLRHASGGAASPGSNTRLKQYSTESGSPHCSCQGSQNPLQTEVEVSGPSNEGGLFLESANYSPPPSYSVSVSELMGSTPQSYNVASFSSGHI